MTMVLLNSVRTDTALQGAVCHWLSGLFLKPPAALEIATYRRGPAMAWLDHLTAEPSFAPGIAAMQQALAKWIDDAALAARLGGVHARLFSGLSGPSTVSPYESAYTGTGRLYQQPAADMAALLHKHDCHITRDWAEAPDHISVELALLARLLTARHPDAADLRDRLARWTPDFAAACAARDPTGFWSGAAALLPAMTGINATAPQNDTLPPETGVNDEHYEPA